MQKLFYLFKFIMFVSLNLVCFKFSIAQPVEFVKEGINQNFVGLWATSTKACIYHSENSTQSEKDALAQKMDDSDYYKIHFDYYQHEINEHGWQRHNLMAIININENTSSRLKGRGLSRIWAEGEVDDENAFEINKDDIFSDYFFIQKNDFDFEIKKGVLHNKNLDIQLIKCKGEQKNLSRDSLLEESDLLANIQSSSSLDNNSLNYKYAPNYNTPTSVSTGKTHTQVNQVRGYYRKDGTYVVPHYRRTK